MVIFGLEPGLGASYAGKRIENDQNVYGIGVIKVDEEKSYLIQQFNTNDGVDDAPALAYYVAVQTDSIRMLSEEDQILDKMAEDEVSEEMSSEETSLNEEPVKKLTKENENFGKRIITPFTRSQ